MLQKGQGYGEQCREVCCRGQGYGEQWREECAAQKVKHGHETHRQCGEWMSWTLYVSSPSLQPSPVGPAVGRAATRAPRPLQPVRRAVAPLLPPLPLAVQRCLLVSPPRAPYHCCSQPAPAHRQCQLDTQATHTHTQTHTHTHRRTSRSVITRESKKRSDGSLYSISNRSAS